MARAMLVGCGCRGRLLATALAADGWAVRGTSRTAEGAAAIDATGAQGIVADPDRLGTVTDEIGDVAVLVWLLGAADGEAGETLNGPRLESLLDKLVDSPVRGLVYEAAGRAPADALAGGAARVEAWGERFRVPARVLRADPADHVAWVAAARAAVNDLLT